MMTLESEGDALSKAVPNLQLIWDSTSLGEFKTCPRKYKYKTLDGYRPKVPIWDLEWGILVHKCIERYHHSLQKSDHEASLRETIRWALSTTWDSGRGAPCHWPDPLKNRVTLVQTVIWYLDEFKDDSLKVVQLTNGRPATELEFLLDSKYSSPSGEPYLLSGRLDRIVSLQGLTYIVDLKTTKFPLDDRYWNQFSPDNQVSLYTLAGTVVFRIPVSGLIIDAIQVGVNFIRSQRQIISRPSSVVDEWYEDLKYWLDFAFRCAVAESWPQNDKACGLYRGCEFRKVCSRSPASRKSVLDAEFVRSGPWKPPGAPVWS